jgi:hypothetical protein
MKMNLVFEGEFLTSKARELGSDFLRNSSNIDEDDIVDIVSGKKKIIGDTKQGLEIVNDIV